MNRADRSRHADEHGTSDNVVDQASPENTALATLQKSESTTSRLQRLLTTEELGDQRPSQLLHRMRQLLGEQASDVNNSILRKLFLQRLPQGVRMVLAPANDMSLNSLAEMADRVAEYAAPTLAALTEPQSSTTAIQELQAKVDQLTVTVASLQKHAGGRNLPVARHRNVIASRSPAGTHNRKFVSLFSSKGRTLARSSSKEPVSIRIQRRYASESSRANSLIRFS
ncbi:hypothetical protein ISCGN_007577 [Ixodes scapularis]